MAFPVSSPDYIDSLAVACKGQADVPAQEGTSKVSDLVRLTELARQALASLSPDNDDKVDRLRQAVQAGDYGPPASKLAASVVSSALARGAQGESARVGRRPALARHAG